MNALQLQARAMHNRNEEKSQKELISFATVETISYRKIWTVAYPIIAGSIAQNIINVIDTAFLGRLGTTQVGAAGNSIIFYYMFMVLGMGFAIGGEIIVARRNGEGKFKEIGNIVDHGFYSLLVLSILLFAFLKLYSGQLLGFVTADIEVWSKSMAFLDIRLYGIFFAFANLGFRIFFIGTTKTSILIKSTAIMAMVNIVLDYLLIFGNWGFPKMGIEGAALGSVCAEASATLYFIIYTFRKVDLKHYDMFKFKKVDTELLKRIFHVSLPMMLQNFAAISSWLIFFLIIEKMGKDALAISHIVRSIYMFMMIPLFGFSAATNVLVSNLIGMGKFDEVLKLTKRTVLMTMAITCLILPFNLFIPEQMLSLYTSDSDLIRQGVSILYVISVAMVFLSLAYILFSAVSGTGNTRTSLLIEIGTLAVYLSFAFFVAIKLEGSLTMVWFSEYIYFGTMGLLSFLYLRYGNWKLKSI